MCDNGTFERFWQVKTLFGCAQHPIPGSAHTVGLAARGLPELHMWAQPTDGADAGPNFTLSGQDLTGILDDYAAQWAAGLLRVGDVRRLSLDGGLTTAVVTIGDPVDHYVVDAFGTTLPTAVPMTWTLHRPARGAAVGIMADARAGYVADALAAVSATDGQVAVTGAKSPTGDISFDVEARYGPLSAVVEAHALAMAGVQRIDLLIEHALAAERVMSAGSLVGLMTTMARLSGRDEQIEQVDALGERVMDRLQMRRAWRDQLNLAAEPVGAPRRRVADNIRRVVATSMTCALMSIALDDVLPSDMALAAQGPWRATLSPSGADPGPRWRCSRRAEELVRTVFAAADARALLEMAESMASAVDDVVGEDVLVAQAKSLTRAVCPPPVVELVPPQVQLTALLGPIQRQLSLFAQLLAAVVDGEHTLGASQREWLDALLQRTVPVSIDVWEVPYG